MAKGAASAPAAQVAAPAIMDMNYINMRMLRMEQSISAIDQRLDGFDKVMQNVLEMQSRLLAQQSSIDILNAIVTDLVQRTNSTTTTSGSRISSSQPTPLSPTPQVARAAPEELNPWACQ